MEVKACADVRKGHGVFVCEPVSAGTCMWRPTMVTKLSPAEVRGAAQFICAVLSL